MCPNSTDMYVQNLILFKYSILSKICIAIRQRSLDQGSYLLNQETKKKEAIC